MSKILRTVRVWGLFAAVTSSLTASAAEPYQITSDRLNPCAVAVTDDVNTTPLSLVSFNEALGGDGCAAECGCQDGYDPATWYVSVGAIYLNRSRPNPSPIITPPTGTPGVVVGAGDFGFSFDWGPELILARRTAAGRIVEARYFNNNEGTATNLVPNITTFRTAGIGVTILGGGSISSAWTSELENFELNVYQPVSDRCSLLAGFRYVELQENLRMNIATPNTFTNWNDNNQMYGAQGGVNFNFTEPGKALQFRGILKGGIYSNNADNHFTSNIVGSNRNSGTGTSFVGEVNFTGSYQLTEHWGLRGGYMVMWIQDVATPGESAAGTRQVAGGTSSPLLLESDLFYHGVSASVEYVW